MLAKVHQSNLTSYGLLSILHCALQEQVSVLMSLRWWCSSHIMIENKTQGRGVRDRAGCRAGGGCDDGACGGGRFLLYRRAAEMPKTVLKNRYVEVHHRKLPVYPLKQSSQKCQEMFCGFSAGCSEFHSSLANMVILFHLGINIIKQKKSKILEIL